jgi:fluoroquinolone transport system permease protein
MMIYRKKVLYYTFLQFLKQISKDAMLVVLCASPVLCGLFFHYGIPFIQSLLTNYLKQPDLLPPYYLLFDLMLSVLTPLLYCFAAAYVILGEIDDGISRYFAVTPVGKKGYLISRIGIPSMIAFIISILSLCIFSLSELTFFEILLITIVSSIHGIVEALLIVAVSGNKVEGMAVSKLSGLFILGLPAPFFLTGKLQFILFFLPSFWVAKYAIEKQVIFIVVGILTATVWVILLYQKFKKKIM